MYGNIQSLSNSARFNSFVAYHESLAKSGTVMTLLMSILKENPSYYMYTHCNNDTNEHPQKDLKHNEAIIGTVRLSYKLCQKD